MTTMTDALCPWCGSGDVYRVNPVTPCCNDCGFEVNEKFWIMTIGRNCVNCGKEFSRDPSDTCSSCRAPDQPWLPLPEGYRLVTNEEREMHDKPKLAKVFSDLSVWLNVIITDEHTWVSKPCAKYAVPTSFQFEQPKPQYKLFEIDWMGYPRLGKELISNYPVINGYRYGWGFTDDELFCDRYKTTAIHGAFKEVACDAYRNRKFAIGRLEE